MQVIESDIETDFSSIEIDPFWNIGDEKELRMHKIHAYPAKFPAFITQKAIAFSRENGLEPKSIADVFCGCGTVAFEAKRSNIDFWGCDLNPVATLIARAKSRRYSLSKFSTYAETILNHFDEKTIDPKAYEGANERLKYWFRETQYLDLDRLKASILQVVPRHSTYKDLFLCAFSNILKPSSVWLTKSIKPQVDPNKKPADVRMKFIEQCHFIEGALEQSGLRSHSRTKIETGDCLTVSRKSPKVDLIVTSPPYVTSYEYADLHQLSALWLDYADDYRDLRDGSIGSEFHDFNFNREVKRLNKCATEMVFKLHDLDKAKSRGVAKYYLDMQEVSRSCHQMLNSKGKAFFVIGNTEYKGIRIDNAKHLVEALYEAGFRSVCATKRKISGKILTPFRTATGKFTSDARGRKVYSEEFIIVGNK